LVLIVMGIVGAGKTTVGTLVAQKLGWQFADADDFHSPKNIEKIRRGIPLDDADRAPWLSALHNAILQWNAKGRNVVLACSALKRGYREELRAALVRFVYLKGSSRVILDRLRSRHGHFANEAILESQLAALEEPGGDEPDVITVDIDQPPDAMVSEIIAKLQEP